MNIRAGGQFLRIGGLFIELLGAVAILSGTPAGAILVLPLPGGNSLSLAWSAIAVGFVLWLVGTAVLYLPQRRGPGRDSNSDEE